MTAKVLVVDDHRDIRDGVRLLLKSQPDLEVVDEARDGVEAVAAAGESKPDLVIMDIAMPRMDGCAATRAILSTRPNTQVLILSSENWSGLSVVARALGAVGFVRKLRIAQELPRAIRQVMGGATYFPDEAHV